MGKLGRHSCRKWLAAHAASDTGGSVLCGVCMQPQPLRQPQAHAHALHMPLTPCTAFCLPPQLQTIQSRLLDVGSAVATPLNSSSDAKIKRVAFPDGATTQLEVGQAASGKQAATLNQSYLNAAAAAAAGAAAEAVETAA